MGQERARVSSIVGEACPGRCEGAGVFAGVGRETAWRSDGWAWAGLGGEGLASHGPRDALASPSPQRRQKQPPDAGCGPRGFGVVVITTVLGSNCSMYC